MSDLKSFVVVLACSIILSSTNIVAGNKEFKEERSEHFIIHYQQGVSKSYVSKMKNKAEKHYRTITQEFNLIRDKLWVWENRAKIFIAKDKESYLSNFNCYTWSDACVDYRSKVIYTYSNQTRFSEILLHELTHIIFREYVKKSALPLWLDEGMATYIEDKYSGGHFNGRIKYLRKKLKNDEHIKISELMSITPSVIAAKPVDYVNLYYLESYSLVKFIITKHGRNNFSRFLSYLKKGNSIESALGKVYLDYRDFDKLAVLWKKYYQK